MNDTIAYRELMADYLDGTLQTSEKQHFDDLLQTDADFRKDYESYRRTVAAIKTLPKVELSEFGRARLRRALKQEKRPLKPIPLFRPMGYAAAAVFLMSIGFVTGRQFQHQETGIVQALPSPAPSIRLRDAQTGSWMDAADFAEHVKRSRLNYAVIPQVRGSGNAIHERVTLGQREVQEALSRQDVNAQTVQFFAPVEVEDNLLEGPEVEFWIQPVSVNLPSGR